LLLLKIILLILAISLFNRSYCQNLPGIKNRTYKKQSFNYVSSSDKIDSDTNNLPGIGSIILSYPYQLAGQTSSVFEIGKKELVWIAAIAGITGGLILTDAILDRNVKHIKNNHKWVNKTSPIITEFGGNYGLLAVSSFAGISLITGDKKGLNTSLYALEAALSSGIWTRLGKILTGRERPSATYCRKDSKGSQWNGPVSQFKKGGKKSSSSFDAFPSGHTAEAFAIATVFAEQYKSNIIVPVAMYTFASIIGLTRMIEHTHWASDVFVGGIIGYLCGKSTLSFFSPDKKSKREKKLKISLSPSLINTYGTDLQVNF